MADTTPPGPPQNVTATALSMTSVEVNFTDAIDSQTSLHRYRIFRDGVFMHEITIPLAADTTAPGAPGAMTLT